MVGTIVIRIIASNIYKYIDFSSDYDFNTHASNKYKWVLSNIFTGGVHY